MKNHVSVEAVHTHTHTQGNLNNKNQNMNNVFFVMEIKGM